MVNDGLLLLLALMTLLLVMLVYAVIMLSPQDAVRTEPPMLNLPAPSLTPSASPRFNPRGPGCRAVSPVTPPAQPGTLMPLPVRAQRCPGAGSPARRRGNQRHSRHARNHRQLTPLAKPAQASAELPPRSRSAEPGQPSRRASRARPWPSWARAGDLRAGVGVGVVGNSKPPRRAHPLRTYRSPASRFHLCRSGQSRTDQP